jgi:curved DNA-binding protein CbpA
MRNPYEVLGVTILSDAETIREAYERLSARCRDAGDPVAGALLKEATAAYELLSDEERRAALDRGGAVTHEGGEDAELAVAGANPFALPPRPRATEGPNTGPPIVLIMLITSVVLLCLIIVFMCTIPGFVMWRPGLLVSVIGALLFSIFKFGMDWIEERAAWRD